MPTRNGNLALCWGAWLLWRIGVNYNSDAVDAAHIVAHGEAQLWGFIGFFVVGISLRTILIDAVRSPVGQRICMLLFGLALLSIAGGLLLGTYLEDAAVHTQLAIES